MCIYIYIYIYVYVYIISLCYFTPVDPWRVNEAGNTQEWNSNEGQFMEPNSDKLGDGWILDVSHSLLKIATQTLQTCSLSIVRIDLNKRAMFYQSWWRRWRIQTQLRLLHLHYILYYHLVYSQLLTPKLPWWIPRCLHGEKRNWLDTFSGMKTVTRWDK